MSSTAKAIRGVQWNYAATAMQMAAQLVFVAIVSRLLEPADFGLMAIATVIVRFGNHLAGAGVRSYLVQKKDLTDADVQAALVLASGMGIALCGATFLIAPWAADVFRSPGAQPVIQVLALSFLVQAFTIPAGSLLHRSLRFRAIATIETAGYISGYLLAGVFLALSGFGVWSLVGATLCQQLVVLILSLKAVRHPVNGRFGKAQLMEIASKGGHFAFNSILDHCVLAAPTAIVGHQLGPADLGVFNRAGTLTNLPTYAISAAASRVVLPYLAPFQTDVARFGRAFMRCATLSTLMFFPVCLGMIPAAPEIVLFVLGDQWIEGIPVFQWLTAAMAMHLVAVQLGTCADAIRRLTSRSILALATLLTMSVAMYLLLDHGLVGAAAGVVVGQLVRLVLYFALISRWLRMTAPDWLSTYAPGIVVGALVAGATGSAHYLLGHLPTPIVLVVEILAAALAWGIGTLGYPQPAFKETLRALLEHAGFAPRIPLLGSTLRMAGLR